MLVPILIGIFFIIIRYNENFNEINISNLMFVVLIILPIIGLFSIIMRVIIKDNSKSTLISSLLLITFFVFIPIHDSLFEEEIGKYDSLGYLILFPIILIPLSIITYSILKSKKNFEKIIKIGVVVILSLVIFNISEIGLLASTNYSIADNSSETFSIYQNIARDVYHIVPDERASTTILKENYDYDNLDFVNYLQNEGFFIPKTSFSNYNSTSLSLPSILNMDYVHYKMGSEKAGDLVFDKIMENNSVVKNFENIGYEVVYFDNEYNLAPTSKSTNMLCGSNATNLRIIFFFIDNTPIVIFKNNLFELIDSNGNEELKKISSTKPMVENRLCIFDELVSLDEKYSEPIFVHAHIILPHGPFLFDANGNVIGDSRESLTGVTSSVYWNNWTSLYLDQLEYTDSKIQEVVKKLLTKEPQPIIIIQSDHGLRDLSDKSLIRVNDFSNFSAYYFPEVELNDDEYPIITSVNSFRILFNTYFGTDYELLENKMYIQNETKYEDITDIIILKDTVQKEK
tara:strand:- start:1300 stop:2841 length:1542 start_codon:yes stop_codon:yes gene_type:complete